jgi:hypothetical protein
MQDYDKIFDVADEKLQLANQAHDLVDRQLRRLDRELAKFKSELEGSRAGVTATLEKRAAALGQTPSAIPLLTNGGNNRVA